MRRAALALGLLLVLMAGPVLAVQPDEVLPDARQEARARELSKELRCLVCQNQSIDDSDAPLAKDLRLLVRERIAAGDTDQQVLDFLVARYGEFVLLRPTLHGANLLLWGAPFAVLVIGAAGAVIAYRRRRSAAEPSAVPLSAEEEARLRAALGEADKAGGDVTKV